MNPDYYHCGCTNGIQASIHIESHGTKAGPRRPKACPEKTGLNLPPHCIRMSINEISDAILRGYSRLSPTPSRNIGRINPKALHQAHSIPGHPAQWHNRGRADRRAPPACSRARERVAAAGHPGPPGRHPQGCRAGRTRVARLRMDFHETLAGKIVSCCIEFAIIKIESSVSPPCALCLCGGSP